VVKGVHMNQLSFTRLVLFLETRLFRKFARNKDYCCWNLD